MQRASLGQINILTTHEKLLENVDKTLTTQKALKLQPEVNRYI